MPALRAEDITSQAFLAGTHGSLEPMNHKQTRAWT
jgi:hypothetical protein